MTARGRLLFSIALAVAGIAAAYADDPVPVQQAPTDDAIGAAKRDLDSLKTSASAAKLEGAGASLKITMPQLHAPEISPDVPVVKTPTLDELKQAQKDKANWLVNAMMKPKEASMDRRKSDQAGRQTKPRDALTSDTKKDATTHDSSDAQEPTASDTDNLKSEAPPNPLAQFMASWVSPQDYALLKRTTETSDRNGSAAVPSAAATPDAVSAFAGLNLDAITGSKEVPATTSAPISNPYLEALNQPPPVAAAQAGTLAPISNPAPAYVPPPPPEPAKPATIPDFAKPPTDDKYFKPLKRF